MNERTSHRPPSDNNDDDSNDDDDDDGITLRSVGEADVNIETPLNIRIFYNWSWIRQIKSSILFAYHLYILVGNYYQRVLYIFL